MIPLLLAFCLLLTACGAAATAPQEPPEHLTTVAQLPQLQPETSIPGRMPELPVSQEPEQAEPEASEEAPEESAEEPVSAPQRVVDPTRPMVALTYDDGPHAVYTDQILDILEENGAVATFLEVAQNQSNAPEARRRPRHIQEFLFVEVKIRTFPIVDQNGALAFFPLAAHDMLAHKRVHAQTH